MRPDGDKDKDKDEIFCHIAIDGRAHSSLGIKFPRRRLPARGARLEMLVNGRSEPVVVERIEPEPDGRWIIWLRNFPDN